MTPAEVAYKLLEHIAEAEGFDLRGAGKKPDRKWILDTYRECLDVVKGFAADSSTVGIRRFSSPDE